MTGLGESLTSPTAAPTRSSFDWRAAQRERAIGRTSFMAVIVVLVAVRVLFAYICDGRRQRREEQETSEMEQRENEKRARSIQKNLRCVKWSQVSSSELPTNERPDNTTDVDHSFSSSAESEDSFHNCSICFLRYDPHTLVCQSNDPNCPHVFHKECMESWLLKHDLCPICRRPYLSVDETKDQA